MCWNAGLGEQLWKVIRSGSYTHMFTLPPFHTQGSLCFCQSINDSNTWTLSFAFYADPHNPLTWQTHTNHCVPAGLDTLLLFSRGKNKQNTVQPQRTSFIPRNTPSPHFQRNIYSQCVQIKGLFLPRRAGKKVYIFLYLQHMLYRRNL